jgi:hypothetical protein
VTRYGDHRSAPAKIAARSASSIKAEVRELRARAARYWTLAEDLHDTRIAAEVKACARELEAEAIWLEKQASFGARIAIQRYRISG